MPRGLRALPLAMVKENMNAELRRAVKMADAAGVRELVFDPCIDVDAPDARGRTPLWWAAALGHPEVVAELLAVLATSSGLNEAALARGDLSALEVRMARDRPVTLAG